MSIGRMTIKSWQEKKSERWEFKLVDASFAVGAKDNVPSFYLQPLLIRQSKF